MSREEKYVFDLLSLETEILQLEEARQELPEGAHINGLLTLAIGRIEERMVALRGRTRSGAWPHAVTGVSDGWTSVGNATDSQRARGVRL
jgi:hypothetical protein